MNNVVDSPCVNIIGWLCILLLVGLCIIYLLDVCIVVGWPCVLLKFFRRVLLWLVVL